MKICTNCNGEGLVGQGDQPWLKHGRIDTCGECHGTGKVVDTNAAGQSENTVNAAENASQDSQTVDNSASNLGDGSQESSGDASQEQTPVLG